MMRFLFLCLLLLPTATAVSEEREGSADYEGDDEDLPERVEGVQSKHALESAVVDKTAGEETKSDHLTMIIIVVAVTVLALSIATIVIIILVRRHIHSRQQGVYAVPTEQDKKGAI